jgi:predicted nucleic-acid-binding Zn-ribbon protein
MGDFSEMEMIEDQERCLKCGKQEGLQGVAVTIGRKTFHLFYLCAKCGNVNIEELVRIIVSYKEKKIDSGDDR